MSDFHHFRVIHSTLFADRHNHINGIENFWNQAKRHMRKFNGVPRAHFGLFLKECEWRFNNSDPAAQLSQLRQWVRRYLTSAFRIAPKLIYRASRIILYGIYYFILDSFNFQNISHIITKRSYKNEKLTDLRDLSLFA